MKARITHLQVLLVLVFYFSAATLYANGGAEGNATIVLSASDGSGNVIANIKHYKIFSSWAAGCEATVNDNFDGRNFGTISSLTLNGHAIVGWTDNSDWVSSIMYYKIWSTSSGEPGTWSGSVKVGNYDTGTTAADVACSIGNNRHVVVSNLTTNLLTSLTPGTYNFKVYYQPQMRYNGGRFNEIYDRPAVTATFTYANAVVQNSYRLAQIIGGNTTYSNTLTSNGTFSFFAETGSPIVLQKKNGDNSWSNVAGKSISPLAYNAVITSSFDFTTLTLGAAQKYKGSYYIRTEIASGGWENYLNSWNDNKMTAFVPNSRAKGDLYDDSYDHYWVIWYSIYGPNPNLAAVVANDYNANLSNQLADYTLSNNANIRFSYNSSTNVMTRTVIGEGFSIKAGGIVLNDLGNWIFTNTYQCKANTPTTTKISADHEYSSPDSVTIREVSSLGHSGKRIEFVYDYKTNRLDCYWITDLPTSSVPHPEMFDGTTDLDAHLKMTSNIFGKPCISLNGTLKGRIYATYTYTVNELANWQWVSFPFDVKMSSITGLDDYTNKWVIAKYDSKKRAKYGLSINDNWVILNNLDTIFANQGVIIGFNNKLINLTGTNTLSLYFQSTSNNINLSGNGRKITTSATYPELYSEQTLPNSGEYAKANQNWYLIGSPMLCENKIVDGPTYVNRYKGKGLGYEAIMANIATQDIMEAYFIQYAGEVCTNLSCNHAFSNPNLAPQTTASSDLHVELNLSSGSNISKTTIVLADDGSDAYDYNKDFQAFLEGGAKVPQLYSICNGEKLSFNHILKENVVTVPIGLVVGSNGMHTFERIANEAIQVTLFDAVANRHTSLNRETYSIELNQGVINNRFSLTLALVPSISTSTDNLAESDLVVYNTENSLFLEHLDGTTLINLYNISGQQLFSTTCSENRLELPKLPQGVYLIELTSPKSQRTIKYVLK